MPALARWVLDHKRLVAGFWIAVTIAAFAAIAPAERSLSQQFGVPGREGFETNQQIAAIYGSGGDVAPLVRCRAAAAGRDGRFPRHQERTRNCARSREGGSPGSTDRLLRLDRQPDVRVCATGTRRSCRSYLPGARAASTCRAAPGRSAPPAVPASRPGSSVRRHRPRRARRGEQARAGGGSSVLLEALIGGLGALVILLFVFGTLPAVLMPLVVAVAAILNTFTLVWTLTYVTDVSIIVQFLIALVGLGDRDRLRAADDLPLPRRAARGQRRRDGARRDDDPRRPLGDRLRARPSRSACWR